MVYAAEATSAVVVAGASSERLPGAIAFAVGFSVGVRARFFDTGVGGEQVARVA